MSNIAKWALLFAAIAVINSCKTVTTSPETGTATIQGRVDLASEIWDGLTPPYSGVTISLVGTNFSAVTDDSGYYTLQGVPTGTYNVLFSKPGYGELRWFSMQVTGGGNAPISWDNNVLPELYQDSKIVATLISVNIENVAGSGTCLVLTGGFTPDPVLGGGFANAIAVFVSHHSDVSDVPGHYENLLISSTYCYPSPTFDTVSKQCTATLPVNYYSELGFDSGDSIYFALYGAPLHVPGTYDYFDPTTQNYVLTSLNPTPSPVIGAKMP